MTPGATDRRDLWCLLLLLAIATIFFADVIFAGSNFYHRDLFIYHFPMKRIVRDAMLSGEFPFWNRSYSNGQPLAANPAYELFYPPQWLILVGSYPFGFALHIVFHVYAALIGMFLLLRAMTLGRAAATFGALSFGMGGFLLGSKTMLPTFFVWALAPIVGWSVLRVAAGFSPPAEAGGHTWSRVAVAALLAGMQLVIGEPMALMQVWLLIAVGTLSFAPRRPAVLAAIAILAVFVGAGQLIPAIDHARDSVRSRGIALEVVKQFSMPPARPLEIAVPHLFGVFDPFVGGYWGANAFDRNSPYLSSIYNGIAVAILVLAGFLVRARGAGTVAVLGVVSYVLAIGDRTPLLKVLYSAGIARGLRYPEKFAALGIVALTIFAATIADRLLGGDARIRRASLIAAGIVVAISAGLVIWSLSASSFLSFWQLPPDQVRLVSLARTEWLLGLAVSGAAAALLVALPHLQRRHWLLLAFTFVLLDLVLLANEIVTRMPKSFFSPPQVLSAFEHDRWAYAVMHRGSWFSYDTNTHQLRARFGPWFARNGLEPFTLAIWGFRSALELDFDETALLPTHDLLDTMMKLGDSGYRRWAESFAAISNVRYLIDYRPLDRVLAEHQPIANARIVRITHLASTGRYYFPHQIVEARTPDDVLAFMKRDGIRRPIAFVPFVAPHVSAARVLNVVESANRAAIDVDCVTTALLVATVTRHKYWSATIDGRTAPLVPVNIAYQGVLVPAGHHRIEMRYRNPLVIWSAAVSALTIVGCLAAIAIAPIRRRRRLRNGP